MSDTRTVTSVQARKSLLKAFSKKRPLFLWGPPGIGKSELVADIAAELGGHMIDLRLGQMEPTDIRGIPFYNKDSGKMDWA
ncbi:MAG: AAA family ATPase, partial [Terrimicrobiaceae bacterium]